MCAVAAWATGASGPCPPTQPHLAPASALSAPYTLPLPIYTPCFLCGVRLPSAHPLKPLSLATVVLKEGPGTCVALAKPMNLFGTQFPQL